MKIFHFIAFILFFCFFSSCDYKFRSSNTDSQDPLAEDKEAKLKLQGIWKDRETDNVLFKIKGDSVYYPDTLNMPVEFIVRNDTLIFKGEREVSYPIDCIGENIFNFHSLTGDIVKLERSYNESDSLLFEQKKAVPLLYNDVIKRDTVVFYDSERYRCYVYINPSKRKVTKTNYTSEGLAVENVFYDNVIHLCVYKGRECIYSRDFFKKDFKGNIPDDFFEQSILSNAVFNNVDSSGFHFYSTICIPDEAACYMFDVCADFSGNDYVNMIEY